MLVEALGRADHNMSNNFTQECWKEMDQGNALLLPSLEDNSPLLGTDQDNNNVEMEEIEDRIPSPLGLFSSLSPSNLPSLSSISSLSPSNITSLSSISPSHHPSLSSLSPSHHTSMTPQSHPSSTYNQENFRPVDIHAQYHQDNSIHHQDNSIHSFNRFTQVFQDPASSFSLQDTLGPSFTSLSRSYNSQSNLIRPSFNVQDIRPSFNAQDIRPSFNGQDTLRLSFNGHENPGASLSSHDRLTPSYNVQEAYSPQGQTSPNSVRVSSPCPLQPVQRSRCNTWPRVMQSDEHLESGFEPEMLKSSLPPPHPTFGAGYASPHHHTSPPSQIPSPHHHTSPTSHLPLLSEEPSYEDLSSGSMKHKISRRNPWGNYSYADLITQAIQSSCEQRLTLSQIYDWLINNIAYFKERADVSTSAGWKNSIRHNLSLHLKFVKVQNEGTGKSSWWTLAPEAKPGPRTPRRRAASMESSKLKREKERAISKVKARLERASSTNSTTSSTGLSSSSFSTEPSSPTFCPRGFEFRARTSSSASSSDGFRPRAHSDVSPPSPLLDFSSPPATLLDFNLSDFHKQICNNNSSETDLDNIHLDNLNIQPGNIIREYLHPESKNPGAPAADINLETSKELNSKSGLNRLLSRVVSNNFHVSSTTPLNNTHEPNNFHASSTSPLNTHEPNNFNNINRFTQEKSTHKLTILEPRESSSSEHQQYRTKPYSPYNSTQYASRYDPDGWVKEYNPEGWVKEYNKHIAGLLGCSDEKFEREKEMKRQEMILRKIGELNETITDLTSEEEAKRTQLMVNLLQDMLPKGDKLKMEVKQEPEPHNNQDCMEDEDRLGEETEKHAFSLYNQILHNNSSIKEEPVNEVEDVPNSRVEVPQVGQVLSAMEEAQMGQLDDSSIRQIERILCL